MFYCSIKLGPIQIGILYKAKIEVGFRHSIYKANVRVRNIA